MMNLELLQRNLTVSIKDYIKRHYDCFNLVIRDKHLIDKFYYHVFNISIYDTSTKRLYVCEYCIEDNIGDITIYNYSSCSRAIILPKED